MSDRESEYDVFISYARDDDKERPFVDRLGRDLEAAGKRVWWDRKCMESRGRPFLTEIRDAIWKAERLIAVIGPHALQSRYVLQEWAYAYHFSKAIVPLLRDGSFETISEDTTAMLRRDDLEKLPDSFDLSQLKALHWLDFRDDHLYRKSFNGLLDKLSADMISLAPVLGEGPGFPPPNYIARAGVVEKLKKLGLVDPKDPKSARREKRLMVIHGPGGSGKTVLANAITHAVQTRWAFPDGIVWLNVGLPPKQGTGEVGNIQVFSALNALGRAFNKDVTDYHDIQSAKLLLTEYLADKQCLLILDDVMDSGEVQEFVDILGRACSMYITTRNKAVIFELSISDAELVSLGDEDLSLTGEEALQLLAGWAEQHRDTLPPEADEIVEICGRLPLAIVICGATVRKGFPWKNLPKALLQAKANITEGKIPVYTKKNINVFTPIQVSLDYLKDLDEEDRQAGREPLHRFDQYLDLSVLRGGVRTPEDVISALWAARRDTDEDITFRLLGDLDAWALLRLVGDEQPYAYVLMHKLQTAYLQKLVDKREREILHREFGQALFKTWRTGTLLGGRQLDDVERRQADTYCQRFLLEHLVEGKRWKELEELLGDLRYLEIRQDKEAQYLLEADIAELLQNREAPIDRILSGAWEVITEQLPLGREQADWLDTFAYWLNKHGQKNGRWASKEIATVARRFDIRCGEISQQLVRKYLNEKRQDWALRYAELSAWACQRAGDLEACAEACEEGEKTCAQEGLVAGYRILGRLEFMRMRARALSAMVIKDEDSAKMVILSEQAAEAYGRLSQDFAMIGARRWRLSKREWQQLEEKTTSGFDFLRQKASSNASCIRVVVVSNEHDALSAMYIIQFLEEKDLCVKWLHHNEFSRRSLTLGNYSMGVLIGGPKAPGFSELANNFLREDREGYLRMYSGLHFGPTTLKAVIERIPCFMLGGVSKAHTLLAAFDFTKREDLNEVLEIQ